jgi:hypothetical protein
MRAARSPINRESAGRHKPAPGTVNSGRVRRERTASAPEWPRATDTPINTPRSRNVTTREATRRKT